MITNISPAETPFLSNLAKSKATNVYHEWLTHTLASAATAGGLEGDVASFASPTTLTRDVNIVLVVGDHHRARHALFHVLRASVEALAEFHDVQTALTERGADGRRWIRRARRHLELDLPQYLLPMLASRFARNDLFDRPA